RPVAQVGAGDLPRLDRRAGAIEDVVRDLERDAEREAVLARAAAEPARRLEELPGLEGATLEVRLDRRRRVVYLRSLQRLGARETKRRVGEDLDCARISGRAQLRERAREEIVARRARGGGPVDRPRGGLAAAEVRAVDEVVVHERRHVDELDRYAGRERRLFSGGRREEDERRTQALASCRERLVPYCRDEPRMGRDGARQPLLEAGEIVAEPGHG